jgi:hypothetical protein
VIQRAFVIAQNGPGKPEAGPIRPALRSRFERHHDHAYVQIVERALMLLQLQQVPTAGQSTKVAVEHEQQPHAGVIRQPVKASIGIRQLEQDRRLPNQNAAAAPGHSMRLLDAQHAARRMLDAAGVARKAGTSVNKCRRNR